MVHLLLAVIYLSFISLGLPDSLLGSAWPLMYPQFEVPVSYAGIVSVIIALGTIVSSLLSDRINHRFGTGKVTVISTALTALGLIGFSLCGSFWPLLLCAIPYGLGAGGVDAALNNYVALHYASRHMSWLHCMWGVGASIGPYIMGFVLAGGQSWTAGYQTIAVLQLILTAFLLLSLPLWKKTPGGETGGEAASKPLSLGQIFAIPGAKAVMLAFFCYCAIEQTAALWASSYLVLHKGIDEETAARFASLFYLGITGGRFLCGFLTMRFDDSTMIRMGEGVLAAGLVCLLLPLGNTAALAGLVLAGIGCAPIYPSIIHSTPAHFGAERSQALIGVQMASAYVGTLAMPPIFGLIARHISVSLLPVYLAAMTVLMVVMHEVLCRRAAQGNEGE